MSALPSKADMLSVGIDVRFVPIADISQFHSITARAAVGMFRDRDAECFGRGQIENNVDSLGY
jgi:hypothetical protein